MMSFSLERPFFGLILFLVHWKLPHLGPPKPFAPPCALKFVSIFFYGHFLKGNPTACFKMSFVNCAVGFIPSDKQLAHFLLSEPLSPIKLDETTLAFLRMLTRGETKPTCRLEANLTIFLLCFLQWTMYSSRSEVFLSLLNASLSLFFLERLWKVRKNIVYLIWGNLNYDHFNFRGPSSAPWQQRVLNFFLTMKFYCHFLSPSNWFELLSLLYVS